MIRCSSVILAVGEAVDRDFCAASGLSVKENGMLEVDRYTLETSRDKFFAGGDLVTGASNVSNAMGYGKDAARHIDARLSGRVAVRRASCRSSSTISDRRTPIPARRHRGARPARRSPAPRPSTRRRRACTPEEAAREAARCLRCDIREAGVHAVVHL